MFTGHLEVRGNIYRDYNIFNIMNMKNPKTEKRIADLFKALGAPFRIRLLYAIGKDEACVCHLEEVLKRRQAYISQHLMVLRDAGILETRREGKYIFYRVTDPTMFALIANVGELMGMKENDLPVLQGSSLIESCCCPHCAEEAAVESK